MSETPPVLQTKSTQWPRSFRHVVVRLGADGLIGAALLLLIVVAAGLASWLPLANPLHIDLHARFTPPGSSHHLLGADALGRDVLSRIVFGGRFTMAVALSATALGLLLGVSAGLMAGYFGGLLDRLLMRLVDIVLSIPVMLLALLVIAALGPSNLHLICVLGLTSWVRFARIVRAECLSLRKRGFVLAARVIGAGPWRILFRHILPVIWPSILTIASLEMSRIVLMEVGLSFLGLGVQPPAPGWGRMLAEGRNYLTTAWWLTVVPGLAIVVTVLSVTLMGNALRRNLDHCSY
ncbi:ABC transporter permease [Telmatobacter bradus]|uniref:ABC transporter permease n=1 Tax=Telmatobacter bradus TaxID=474953 RepID=UPI003B430745